MSTTIVQWLSIRSKRMVNSIAFFPALIAFLFLGAAVAMVFFDYSETGKQIKSSWSLLRLRDASTARSIISAITAGLISLTVFSFSMVMIVLNQAASQLSNRILDKLIGNRFQQIVLGFYIGTIVYSLFLLSTIRDIDDDIYVPSLSTYLLILLTVGDIFLFIYFLHYITQSVKYEIIINRIHRQTTRALQHTCRLERQPEVAAAAQGLVLTAPVSGIFTGFDKDGLLQAAKQRDCLLSFLHPLGQYVLKGLPLMVVSGGSSNHEDEWKEPVASFVYLSGQELIDDDFNYGFRQLMEVAVKALSPGVNDPATAVTSLRSLADLLAYRLTHFPGNTINDTDGTVRIITSEPTFEEIFNRVILPIWDYGKNDRMIQQEMQHLLQQLLMVKQQAAVKKLLAKVQRQIELDGD